jgi:hypothetical protein
MTLKFSDRFEDESPEDFEARCIYTEIIENNGGGGHISGLVETGLDFDEMQKKCILLKLLKYLLVEGVAVLSVPDSLHGIEKTYYDNNSIWIDKTENILDYVDEYLSKRIESGKI